MKFKELMSNLDEKVLLDEPVDLKSDVLEYIKDILDEEDDVTLEEQNLLEAIYELVEHSTEFNSESLEYVLDRLENTFDSHLYDEDYVGNPVEAMDESLEEASIKKVIRDGKIVKKKKGYKLVGGRWVKVKRSAKVAWKKGARKRRHKKIKGSTKAHMKRMKKKSLRKQVGFDKRRSAKRLRDNKKK